MKKKTRNFKKLADVLDVPGYEVRFNHQYGEPVLVCKGHKRAYDHLIRREAETLLGDCLRDSQVKGAVMDKTYDECKRDMTDLYELVYGGWENVLVQVPQHIIPKKHKYGKTMFYYYYSLTDSRTGKNLTLPVSNLVWMYHHPNEEIPDGYDIDHINGDSLDDRIENLQCITRKENLAKRKGAKNQFDYIKGRKR